MLFALTLSVDGDVIEIQYCKNVELLGQDILDLILKRGQCVGQSEKHDLVLEMAVAGPESRLSFIVFPDPHSMVEISQIELGEMSKLT